MTPLEEPPRKDLANADLFALSLNLKIVIGTLAHRLEGQEERRADPGVRTALFGPIFIAGFYVGPRTSGMP
jgi:hypothetical protein